jgi:F0F1-type ATP synthase membrane subunit b/b'
MKDILEKSAAEL